MRSTEDDALRDYFRRRADERPIDPDFRELVRARLAEAHMHEPPSPRRRWDRLLVAASVVALFGALGAALVWSGRQDDSSTLGQSTTVVERVLDPIPIDSGGATPVGTDRRIESTVLRTPLYFDVPPDEDRIVVIAATPDVLEVSLAGATDASPPGVPIVRILAPPSGTTVAEIEAGLARPHFDTVVTGVGNDELGARATRVVRMESDAGTTAVGFEIGPDVFVAASGVDRRYEAHILETVRGPLVIWIDAPAAAFDTARVDAASIVASLHLID
jgi:hypothetical protein